jgi:hypothetical protein
VFAKRPLLARSMPFANMEHDGGIKKKPIKND